MKEVELSMLFLKKLSDGLKALSQGVETFAKKIDDMAMPSAEKPAKAAAKPAAKPKPARGKREQPAPAKERKATPKRNSQRAETALEDVWNHIAVSSEGLDTQSLMSKTGYDQKKIHNLVYKLKKQGKIKTLGKGIYIRA